MLKKVLVPFITLLAITTKVNALELEKVICETSSQNVTLVVNNPEWETSKIYVNATSTGYPLATETGWTIPHIGRQTIGFSFPNIGTIETLIIYTTDLQINATLRECTTVEY